MSVLIYAAALATISFLFGVYYGNRRSRRRPRTVSSGPAFSRRIFLQIYLGRLTGHHHGG